MESAELTDSN